MVPMESNPLSEARSVSSAPPAPVNIESNCEGLSDQTTRASKLRLSGPLCANGEKASVLNDTNRYTATVFTDSDLGKFSTDTIPLNTGRNLIKVEFVSKDGQSTTQSLVIHRE
jgi:hypothetical protein